jgi:hypothetical protein
MQREQKIRFLWRVCVMGAGGDDFYEKPREGGNLVSIDVPEFSGSLCLRHAVFFGECMMIDNKSEPQKHGGVRIFESAKAKASELSLLRERVI